MDPCKVEGNDDGRKRNIREQNGNPTGASMGFLERFLMSYLWTGPAKEDVTSLACVNTVYLLFVFWFVMITSLLYTPPVKHELELELTNCKKESEAGTISGCDGLESTDRRIDIITVRIGFTLEILFMSLLLASALYTPPWKIHQGFWLVKILLFLIVLPLSFVIPGGWFDQMWGMLSFFGSLMFYGIEAILILDLSTAISDFFVFKITEERSRLWYCLWLLIIWGIYIIAAASTFILYAFYGDNCGLNAVLISIMFILSTLFSLITAYFSGKRTGFLHSGLGILFVLLLTLVTLNHGRFCRAEGDKTDTRSGDELPTIILKSLEIILGFFLIIYAVLRNFRKKYYYVCGTTVSRDFRAKDDRLVEVESFDAEQQETEILVFNICAFFSIFVGFVFFVTTKLTLLKQGEVLGLFTVHTFAFHMRSLTIIMILIMMIWSQIFPVVPVVYPNENPYDLLALAKTFFKSQLTLSRRILIDGSRCCNGPVASRYIYTVLYILGVLFSGLLFVPEVRHRLSKSTYFCSTVSTRGVCLNTDPAYMAVYRVCFAMAVFFLLFAVVLVCVNNTPRTRKDSTHAHGQLVDDSRDTAVEKNSNDFHVNSTQDPRVDLQYKAWPVKICLFCSLLLASFLLPNEFSLVWIYVSLTGTFLFTILQLILLIYWTKYTRRTLEEKVVKSYSKFWSTLLTFGTVIMIFVSLGAVVTFFVFFSKRCFTNTIFITLNLVLAVAASLISIHPKIYDAGLFQCFIIIIFSLYLTWSGLSHNPDEKCNPVAGYIAEVDMRPNLNIQAGLDLLLTFVTVLFFSVKVPEISQNVKDVSKMFVDFLSGQKSSRNCAESSSTISAMECETKSDFQEYNFSLFHTVYFLASLHATVILTNWFIPTPGSRFKLSVNWAAMCVKMTTSNLSLFIYVCLMVAPFLTK
ncbi:uncharacterized protein LOC114532543 [Dendronephthya gigantea]|uniref:uncharacterized protein LOC114532543 n=1 Tax=Dendronephthya gigantea TaxID=151771 RepID=UPI00106AE030|nr:uncharacterized protein LOC114532543 [Dendronephthya gigantea]